MNLLCNEQFVVIRYSSFLPSVITVRAHSPVNIDEDHTEMCFGSVNVLFPMLF